MPDAPCPPANAQTDERTPNVRVNRTLARIMAAVAKRRIEAMRKDG